MNKMKPLVTLCHAVKSQIIIPLTLCKHEHIIVVYNFTEIDNKNKKKIDGFHVILRLSCRSIISLPNNDDS